jgi:pimeloyl-ACP methyl ester carboxylesterase
MRRRLGDPYGRTMTETYATTYATAASEPDVERRPHADDDRVADFRRAEQRVLERYGVVARSQQVLVPQLGIDLHVLVAGAGPPVLMAIGGGMVAALWAPLIAQLTGRTAIAFDPPGHGLSDAHPYSTRTLRSTAVGFIDALLDEFSVERAPIVAQSMGGLWSTWYALDRPTRVSAISYIGCPALILGTSAPLPLRLGTVRPLHHLLDRVMPPSTRQVERLGRMAGEPLAELPELRDLFLAYERLPGTSAELLGLHRAAIRVRGARPEVALRADELRAVRQPAQFVWGSHDPFGSPDVGRRATDLMPDAEFHMVDAGHGPWFTRPDDVGALVSTFLDRHDTPTPPEPTPAEPTSPERTAS